MTILEYYTKHCGKDSVLGDFVLGKQFQPVDDDTIFEVFEQNEGTLSFKELKQRAKTGGIWFDPNPFHEGKKEPRFTLLKIKKEPAGMIPPGLILGDGNTKHLLIPHIKPLEPKVLETYRNEFILKLKEICCRPDPKDRISTRLKVHNPDVLEGDCYELWQRNNNFTVWGGLEKRFGKVDKNAMICHETRFLCKGGSFLIVAPSGVGKSTLLMQMAISWSANRDFFGLKPKKALRCFLLQGENDDGDVVEMAHGIKMGLALKPDEENLLRVNFVMQSMFGLPYGKKFYNVLADLIKFHRPDVFFVDPLFAFLDGDFNSQVYGSETFRREIDPVLKETGCILVASHHTPKPSKAPSRSGGTDLGYGGFGSSELTNWFRAVATLRPEKGLPKIFRFIIAKRGNRAGFSNGLNYCQMQHSSKGWLFWEPVLSKSSSVGSHGSGSQDYETEREARKLLKSLNLTSPATRNQILARIMRAKGDIKSRQAANYWALIRNHFIKVDDMYTLIPPEDLAAEPVSNVPDSFETATATTPQIAKDRFQS